VNEPRHLRAAYFFKNAIYYGAPALERELEDKSRQLEDQRQELDSIHSNVLVPLMDTVEATVGGPLDDHLLDANSGPGPWYGQTRRVYEHMSALNIYPTSDDEEDANMAEFPWSHDPAPGPLPNTYDLRHGHIDKISVPIEPYYQPVTNKFPEISNRGLGLTTLGPGGKKKKKSGGGVDWTCGMIALANIDRSMPSKIWFFLEDGQLILRWDTRSRTRSRTLAPFQTLPPEARFDFITAELRVWPDESLAHGPAWSCYNCGTSHNQQMPILPFWVTSCPLCKVPRSNGLSVAHDFYIDTKDRKFIHLDRHTVPMRQTTRNKRAKTDEAVEETEENVERMEEVIEGNHNTKRMKMEHAVDPDEAMHDRGVGGDEGSDVNDIDGMEN
jgi:hypothetical protein